MSRLSPVLHILGAVIVAYAVALRVEGWAGLVIGVLVVALLVVVLGRLRARRADSHRKRYPGKV